MNLAVVSLIVAGIALAWQILTWATLRRTRVRVLPVIYYELPGESERGPRTQPVIKVGVRVINLSDHQVEVRSVALHLEDPHGSTADPLETKVNVLIPGRMASHRHFVSDWAQHHTQMRATAYAERGDGRWVPSWEGWALEPPTPPHLTGWILPPVLYPAPGRWRRWRLTLGAIPGRARKWLRG